MTEPFEYTVARKIQALEEQVRQLQTRPRGYTMGDVVGTMLSFRGLRGFWPISSEFEGGNIADISGQGRTLTNNNNATRALEQSLVTSISFNGSNQYLSRADEAGLDITGHITFGGWFYVNAFGADGTVTTLMSKSSATAGNYSYALQIVNNVGGTHRLRSWVSGDGTAIVIANGPNEEVPLQKWFFAVGRFFPNIELDCLYNDGGGSNLTGIPGSIFSGTGVFTIGNMGGTTQWLNGRAALPFVCAQAVAGVTIYWYYRISRSLLGV